MNHVRLLSILGLSTLPLAIAACPETYAYPNSAVGRYCRQAVETCHASVSGTPLTGADCVQAFNASRDAVVESCRGLVDAEWECVARAACDASNPCAAEHEATNQCQAAGGMGGGI
jgi:hypothetical protein